MPVSKARLVGPTPDDIEFRALEGDITILPSIALPANFGLDGPSVVYGPLQPPRRATVPLWLAIHLKKKRKCHIDTPTWLTIPKLEATLRDETNMGGFSYLPFNYIELSKVLLEVAPDDIPNSDKVRILLKDIREVRQSKVRDGLQDLTAHHLAMPNLSQMELSELRGFFSLAHRRLVTLDPENELHGRIEQLWLDDPDKALRLAPEPQNHEMDEDAPPNRLVEMFKDEMAREKAEADMEDEDEMLEDMRMAIET